MYVPKLRFKEFNDEWGKYYVGNLCNIQTGKSNTQDKIENGLYPFYVRSAIVEHSNKYIFDTEAVLTVGDGVGTGKVFHYVNGKFDCHQRVYVLNNFKNVTAKFFYYSFSKNFIKRVNSMTAKTSVDSVRYEMIDKMVMYLPILYEQEKIGTFLSLLDKEIELQSKKIETLKLYKKGLYKLYFYNNSKKYKEIPLKNICNITTGKLDANAMTENGKYRFYTCAKDYYYIDEYAFDTEALLISGNGAYVGYIHYYKGKFNAYQRTYVLTNFKYNIKYIKYYLDCFLSKRINSEKKEGNTPYIVMGTLSNMNIKLPSEEEQERISSNFDLLTDKINLEEIKLNKLESLKKGLMQNMFV